MGMGHGVRSGMGIGVAPPSFVHVVIVFNDRRGGRTDRDRATHQQMTDAGARPRHTP